MMHYSFAMIDHGCTMMQQSEALIDHLMNQVMHPSVGGINHSSGVMQCCVTTIDHGSAMMQQSKALIDHFFFFKKMMHPSIGGIDQPFRLMHCCITRIDHGFAMMHPSRGGMHHFCFYRRFLFCVAKQTPSVKAVPKNYLPFEKQILLLKTTSNRQSFL